MASRRRRRCDASNTARMFVTLKPLDERTITRRPGHRAAAPQARPASPARRPVPAGRCRTSASAGGRATRSTSTRCRATTVELADGWAPRHARDACGAARARRRQQRPAEPGLQATLVIDRDTASRLGITAQADRRHALRRLRPAPGLDDVHAAQPVPRRHGGRARSSGRAPRRSTTSTCSRRAGSAGAAGDVRRYAPDDHAAGGQPPGPVPVGDALVQPRAGRRARRRGRRRSSAPSARSACPRPSRGSFQGTAQAFQASLANQPLLILAALAGRLHRARHALRELHPPDHDPVHAAVGRRRRAPGAAALPDRARASSR